MKMLSYLRYAVTKFERCPLHFGIVLLSFLFTSYGFKNQNEVRHTIKVIHKGISLDEPVVCILVEVRDENNKPKAFYMDVESVVCGDSQCRVDVVRIYWDQWGQYNRLELPSGVELEKAAGENFSADDYEKLDRILADGNSPLQEVYKQEVVSTVSSEGVDGMTGATVLVEKSAYVAGAVWTCYSLWHWTHGETRQIIRNLTGDAHSITDLRNLLQNTHYQQFAIEQLTKRQDFSAPTVQLVTQAIEKNPKLLEASISYWTTAPNSVLEAPLLHLIEISSTSNRLHCLNAILSLENKLSPHFFQSLSKQLPQFTYPEIHLFLNVLRKQKAMSNVMVAQLFPLLNSKDFLVARRVYWFLSEQSLDDEKAEVLEQFYLRYESRL